MGGLLSLLLYTGIMMLRKDVALQEYWGILMTKPFFRRLLSRLPQSLQPRG